MSAGELLFSSAGRLSRAPFVVAGAALMALVAVYDRWAPPNWRGVSGWLIHPAALFCGACLLCKRLHDRGRSGWLAAAVLLALGVVWVRPMDGFDLPFAAVLAWAGFELAVLPGQPRFNLYGAPPADRVR